MQDKTILLNVINNYVYNIMTTTFMYLDASSHEFNCIVLFVN